jgi:prepilin-type N-terminal cleavage/methylation domain-containing protein
MGAVCAPAFDMTALPFRRFGFTLVELLVALLICALLTLGLVRLAQAAGTSFQLQQNLAGMLENARFALFMIGREVAQAGYHPEPWQTDGAQGVLLESIDDVSDHGDRLVLWRWSQQNCFENINPELDAAGQPLFYLRVSRFEISASGQLSLHCRYGPAADRLVTQVNRLGLVENIVSLQVLFAEDSDADRNADRWVKAGAWADERNVMGVRLGLLLTSDRSFPAIAASTVSLLDEPGITLPSGRLHQTLDTLLPIMGSISR